MPFFQYLCPLGISTTSPWNTVFTMASVTSTMVLLLSAILLENATFTRSHRPNLNLNGGESRQGGAYHQTIRDPGCTIGGVRWDKKYCSMLFYFQNDYIKRECTMEITSTHSWILSLRNTNPFVHRLRWIRQSNEQTKQTIQMNGSERKEMNQSTRKQNASPHTELEIELIFV